MATPEEKERNIRLRKEAADAKFARQTKQTPNAKEAKEEEPLVVPTPAPEISEEEEIRKNFKYLKK